MLSLSDHSITSTSLGSRIGDRLGRSDRAGVKGRVSKKSRRFPACQRVFLAKPVLESKPSGSSSCFMSKLWKLSRLSIQSNQ